MGELAALSGELQPEPRKAGRPPGARNKPKRRLVARLEADFPEYHPVAALAELVNNEQDPPLTSEQKIKIHAEIARYVEPQLKAVTHSGAIGFKVVLDRDAKDLT